MKRYLTVIYLLTATASISSAQVYSPNANHRQAIEGDSIFLFSSLSEGTLTATASAESTIEWYKLNTEDGTVADLITSTSGTSSTLQPLDNGGYLTKITTNGTTTEYRSWCYMPKIDSVSMTIDSVTCNGLYAKAKAHGKDIRPIIAGKPYPISQKFIYNWYISDTLALTTNLETIEITAPMEDGELRVEALNQAEITRSKTDSVSSWGVRASYTHKEREHGILHEITKADAISAPAEIEFKNTSLGDFTVCEWIMGNVARLYETNPVYSFQTSGKYKVTLIVTNEMSGCSSVDSTLEVTVTDSELEFPNAFSPNGDEVNDEFRPAYKSIKTYNIAIYNRWGRKIYESDDITKGWDGKNGNSHCAEGVYMYVAEAEGFDKGVKFTRKGSVTLVR